MKKTLLGIIYFLACIFSIQAQVLYGTTYNGGNEGGGTINKFMPATNNLTVAKSLENIGGKSPKQNFIQASDGKLYGMTVRGGSKGLGVIFSFDPSTSTYTTLKDLDGISGNSPNGSLVQANDGKLYGMALSGGSSNVGTIFSYDLSSSTYTKLKDFDNTNGAFPYGSLMQASDGKLYGMTQRGGGSDAGVIFSFDPASSTYTKLKDLDNINGSGPVGSLIQASDGKLYGMAGGGSNGYGVIFSFTPSSSIYAKLKDFDNANGGYPSFGSLFQANDGKLYGTVGGGSNGRGVIFSFDPAASTYTKLKDFDGTNGSDPTGSLMQANDGKLYGMTTYGGSNIGGVIFSFDLSGSTYTKLKDFEDVNGANGAAPSGGLLQASDGMLYGMTEWGGNLHSGGSGGVIFSFDALSSTYTKLKDFGTNETGSNIPGNLVQAGNGKLYGIAQYGGSSNAGVIFSLDPSSSTYTKLKDFDNANDANPTGSLIKASDGKLYGSSGNAIFSFDPSTSVYTNLVNGGGAYPGSLMQANNGKLYGMMQSGGSESLGAIFSFDPPTSTYTKFHDFDGANGVYPSGSLIQANDGKLYGVTRFTYFNFSAGPTGNGTIFSYDLSSSTFTTLKNFDGVNGTNPSGSLMQASDGKLYGMAGGGSNGYGVIFSFDPSSSAYTRLKDFDGTDGSYPNGNLMQASDGKLYGATSRGGTSDLGVIFSFDPLTSTYTKLQDYTGANGANPYSGFIELNQQGNVTYCNASGVCSNKGFIKNVYACYSFNNTTCCTGYGDYTAKGVNTAPGKLLGFSVTPGYNSGTDHPLIYIRVWIDWNGDGDFTDGGEMVYAPFYPVNVKAKFWIRVPAGTGTGRKRMRVIVSADYKMSPCGTIANGEVEDYSINIRAARFAVPDAGPDAFDEAGETFTIYPNPVKNKMIIERSGYDEDKANNAPALMVITNANGKTLMQSRLVNLVQAVDVSRLPSGVYFVTIISGNNKTTNKMIINR